MEKNDKLREELLNSFTNEELYELKKMISLRMNEKNSANEKMKNDKLFLLRRDRNYFVNVTDKDGIDASKITEKKSISVAQKTYKLYKNAIKGCTNADELYASLFNRKSSRKGLKIFSLELSVAPVVNKEVLERMSIRSRMNMDEWNKKPNKQYFEEFYRNVTLDDVYYMPVYDERVLKEYMDLFTSLPINYSYISKLHLFVGDEENRFDIDEFVRFEDYFYELERLGLTSYTKNEKGFLYDRLVYKFLFVSYSPSSDGNYLVDNSLPTFQKTKMKFPTK